MIPENRKSSIPVAGVFIPPDDRVDIGPLVDYERGGIAVSDPSEGLRVKEWQFYYDGTGIYCVAEGVSATLVVEVVGVTELSGTFDQNMLPCVAYMKDEECHLNWFDTWDNVRRDQIFENQRDPKVALDDKRDSQFANSDIVFAYIRDNRLCWRQQRDRFLVERVLHENLPDDCKLKNIGMTNGWRLKFEFV